MRLLYDAVPASNTLNSPADERYLFGRSRCRHAVDRCLSDQRSVDRLHDPSSWFAANNSNFAQTTPGPRSHGYVQVLVNKPPRPLSVPIKWHLFTNQRIHSITIKEFRYTSKNVIQFVLPFTQNLYNCTYLAAPSNQLGPLTSALLNGFSRPSREPPCFVVFLSGGGYFFNTLL